MRLRFPNWTRFNFRRDGRPWWLLGYSAGVADRSRRLASDEFCNNSIITVTGPGMSRSARFPTPYSTSGLDANQTCDPSAERPSVRRAAFSSSGVMPPASLQDGADGLRLALLLGQEVDAFKQSFRRPVLTLGHRGKNPISSFMSRMSPRIALISVRINPISSRSRCCCTARKSRVIRSSAIILLPLFGRAPLP